MMRTLTKNELDEVLRKHTLWVRGMKGGERADLSGVDLSETDLSRADLSNADLSRADLSETNLREADLYGAILRYAILGGAELAGADLSEANLSRADLSEANMVAANLRRANLSRADLSGADLVAANLREADLYRADMCRANLSEADMWGASLFGADLSGADLSGASNISYIPLACPEEGAFIGFKKAYNDQIGHQPVIVKLLILEDAKRSSATTNKCRCNKAKVLDIQDIFGNSVNIVAYSKFDTAFVYKIGETIEVKDFDENRFNECAPGIHFFINRYDAVNY